MGRGDEFGGGIAVKDVEKALLTPSYGGRGWQNTPPHVFANHSEAPQTIQLKRSYCKDTSLRHILQIIAVRYGLSCYHGNKITKCTPQNLASQNQSASKHEWHTFRYITMREVVCNLQLWATVVLRRS